MRLGWDQSSINAPELARRAEAEGIQLITVHGRTRCQFYKGKADWSAIEAVKHAISVPLIANGDLLRPEDAPAMLAQSGANGVMIGRGSYGAPWIVGQTGNFLKNGAYQIAPWGKALAETVCAHYEDMLQHYGVELGVRQARKHLDWYMQAANVDVPVEERRALMTCETPAEVLSHLDRILSRSLEPEDLLKASEAA